MADSLKAAENVADAGKEAYTTQNKKEYGLGVQPAVEKKAKKAPDHDGGDEDKGQLHGNGSLVGDFLGFFR